MNKEDQDRVKRILRDAGPDTLALAVQMGYDPHRRYENDGGQNNMTDKQSRYIYVLCGKHPNRASNIEDLFGGLWESEPITASDAMFCIKYLLGEIQPPDLMEVAPDAICKELAYVLRVGGAGPASRRAASLSRYLADLSIDLTRMSRELLNHADAHGAPPDDVNRLVAELDVAAVRESLENTP